MGKDKKVTLVFVHGYGVTDMDSYGQLPEAIEIEGKKLVPDLKLNIQHIYLSRYISFHDEVTMDDTARAFNQARLDAVGEVPFSCITHSTGGPAIRCWVDLYYGARNLESLPLRHLIMLAPANHGSALAQLGKGRLGRIKTWFTGIEPGQKILDWLELNSSGQWNLNEPYLSYKLAQNNFFPFHDDRGNEINDYDILLLGSKKYSPDELPRGFFADRQRNRVNGNRLTYYVDCAELGNMT